MTDIEDNPDLASDLSAIAMNIIMSDDPNIHGELQEAFAAALAPFEAENQRLREALRRIEATPAWGYPDHWEMIPAEVRQLARAALHSPKPSNDD